MTGLQIGLAAVAVAGVAGIVGLILGRPKALWKWARAGRRPDGSWEEGRRLRDMTPWGKLLLVTTGVAWAASVVLSFVTQFSPWFWVSALVGIGAAFGVAISERRRLRRQGIDPLR